MSEPLLKVRNLNVKIKLQQQWLTIIHHLDFDIQHSEILGIVGESGSGKSQTALAIMGLSSKNTAISGSLQFNHQELIGLSSRDLNKIRGNSMAMVFQDPMTSLNPYLKISTQMCETLVRHQGMSHKEALQQSIAMLDAVKISNAKDRIHLYPHEFSGGMRQRVMVAMALLCQPKLLIADEPTTALDVTVQAEILQLLRELRQEFKTAIILITHDLGIVANLCDRVMVMYAGRMVADGRTQDILGHPAHPYTQGLLQALPSHDQVQERLISIEGNPPNIAHLPSGCTFHPRCPHAQVICKEKAPDFLHFPDGQRSACHFKEVKYV